MENIIQYFYSISVAHRTSFLAGGLTFFLILESGAPEFKFIYNKTKHALLNFFYMSLTLIINLAGASLILFASKYNSVNKSGILNLIEMPIFLKVALGILLLDLVGAWLVHWMEHNVKWMWKFHIVHHTDRQVDVTSGLRHHPVESIFRLLFTAIAVFFSGASFGTVMLYQTISGFFAHLTHANIKKIEWLDPILSKIIVTPHFHKLHHHFMLPETDKNYGNIFSIWDHLFNTAKEIKDNSNIRYGLDTHMSTKETENIKTMLLIPFQKYRLPVGSKFRK